VHLVGFLIRNYHDARSPERQIQNYSYLSGTIWFFEIRQEVHLVLYMTIRHRFHKRPPPIPVVSLVNSVHTTSYIFKVYF